MRLAARRLTAEPIPSRAAGRTVTNMLPNYEERILIIRKGRAGISTVSRKLGIEGATR